MAPSRRQWLDGDTQRLCAVLLLLGVWSACANWIGLEFGAFQCACPDGNAALIIGRQSQLIRLGRGIAEDLLKDIDRGEEAVDRVSVKYDRVGRLTLRPCLRLLPRNRADDYSLEGVFHHWTSLRMPGF
jgi:hypothetical protein